MVRSALSSCFTVTSISITFLLAICLFNALNAVDYQSRFDAELKNFKDEFLGALSEKNKLDMAIRFSKSIHFKTVSHEDPIEDDPDELRALHDYLEFSFPKVHEFLKREKISNFSLLYTWEGTDPSLKPLMFAGHLDVVPIDQSTAHQWTYPPFEGRIAEGYIWGRGTMDDRVAIFGLLETAERLLNEGYKPRHTIIFAFGHDEEVTGKNGAGNIAKILHSRGVKAEFILDEGMIITREIVPFLSKDVALVGTAEKGYVTLELSVETKGGHSSMPPVDQSSIGIISNALVALENNPFPQDYRYSNEMFKFISSEMGFLPKVVLTNAWLFKPIILRVFAGKPSTNAQTRTTTALTIFKSGMKENVLPATASAKVNFRIAPSDTIESVVTRVRSVINDDRIKIKIGDGTEPAPVTSSDTKQFEIIHKSIRQTFPEVLVAPGMMIGATDTKHYWNITSNIFRFTPMTLTSHDLPRLHGVDERLSVDGFSSIVAFYRRFLLNSDKELSNKL